MVEDRPSDSNSSGEFPIGATMWINAADEELTFSKEDPPESEGLEVDLTAIAQ